MSDVKTRNFRDTTRKLVTSPDEMPDFENMSPEEEAEFWETHDFAEGVLEDGPEINAEVYEALGIPDPSQSLKEHLPPGRSKPVVRPARGPLRHGGTIARSAQTGRFAKRSYTKRDSSTVVKRTKKK